MVGVWVLLGACVFFLFFFLLMLEIRNLELEIRGDIRSDIKAHQHPALREIRSGLVEGGLEALRSAYRGAKSHAKSGENIPWACPWGLG